MLRLDQEILSHMISPERGERVMDIGCGDGALLIYLREQYGVHAHGLEIDEERVARAVERGISAVQADADTELSHYPDGGFDYIILANTLQNMKHPHEVLRQSLRIGRRVCVVTPNFGHWYNRLYLGMLGKMPVSKALRYQWYETPNIHFSTIRDFALLCDELECNIVKSTAIYGSRARSISPSIFFIANLLAHHAIFLLEKPL